MAILNASTFIATGTEEVGGRTRETGTVEMTIGRQTRRVDAVRVDSGTIISWAANGKYATGKKLWPATIRLEADGRESVWFGRDHSARRCLKTGLFFA